MLERLIRAAGTDLLQELHEAGQIYNKARNPEAEEQVFCRSSRRMPAAQAQEIFRASEQVRHETVDPVLVKILEKAGYFH